MDKPIYLTSTNKVKCRVGNEFISKLESVNSENDYKLISIESESGIERGQPYGYNEIMTGCKNRAKIFKNGENYISIENGFIVEDDKCFDIAFIIVKLNDIEYSTWSHKRPFPKEICDIDDIESRTLALEKHFEENFDTRYVQLLKCINSILKEINPPLYFEPLLSLADNINTGVKHLLSRYKNEIRKEMRVDVNKHFDKKIFYINIDKHLFCKKAFDEFKKYGIKVVENLTNCDYFIIRPYLDTELYYR